MLVLFFRLVTLSKRISHAVCAIGAGVTRLQRIDVGGRVFGSGSAWHATCRLSFDALLTEPCEQRWQSLGCDLHSKSFGTGAAANGDSFRGNVNLNRA